MFKSKLKMSYFPKGLRNSFQQKVDFKKVTGTDGKPPGFVCKTASTQRHWGTLIILKRIFIQKYGNHVLSVSRGYKFHLKVKKDWIDIVFFKIINMNLIITLSQILV